MLLATLLRRSYSAGGALASSNGGSVLPAQIIKFAIGNGEQFFGVFADKDQTHAHVVSLDDSTGRLTKSDAPVQITAMLPPVDAVALIGIGLNYKKHAMETGSELPKQPVMFLKSVSSLTGHSSAIVIPRIAQTPPEVDFEGELAVVIGRECRNATVSSALSHVLGYTIANDVSARRWQKRAGGGQWSLGKSFDTFCPLGPFMIPANEVDPSNLTIETRLNGELMQHGSTSDMIFSVPEIIAYLSQGMTLLPGTVILTGTPEGVGYSREPPVFLKRGDTVSVSITGLGTLTNYVAEETEWGSDRMA